MTQFRWWWESKSKTSDLEKSNLDSFMRGFELGVKMASEFDEKAKSVLMNKAINESLRRMNGNHKTTD